MSPPTARFLWRGSGSFAKQETRATVSARLTSVMASGPWSHCSPSTSQRRCGTPTTPTSRSTATSIPRSTERAWPPSGAPATVRSRVPGDLRPERALQQPSPLDDLFKLPRQLGLLDRKDDGCTERQFPSDPGPATVQRRVRSEWLRNRGGIALPSCNGISRAPVKLSAIIDGTSNTVAFSEIAHGLLSRVTPPGSTHPPFEDRNWWTGGNLGDSSYTRFWPVNPQKGSSSVRG